MTGPLSRSFGLLDVAVFERTAPGAFRLVGTPPRWVLELCPEAEVTDPAERFPFLSGFLIDAEELWEKGSGRATSGIWCETNQDGSERFLEATAACLESERLLLVQSLDHRYEERRDLLQKARGGALAHERLRHELDKKEVLLHCIIHDLKAPLSAMVGTMSLLKSRSLAPERVSELLELGLEQARHQKSMIGSILDVFSSEIRDLESFSTDPSSAPDLLDCVRRAVEAYRSPYDHRGVGLEVSKSPSRLAEARVVAQEERLDRVIANLLENALRYSPSGSRVTVEVSALDDGFEVRIEDEGPGVDPSRVDGLFQRFAGGGRAGGVIGLGLYFCRTTVELWGGSIGYAPRAEGSGSRFWFRLVRPA